MVVRVVSVVDQGNVVVARKGTEEIVGYASRVLRQEVRAVRNSVEGQSLRNVLPEYTEIGGVHLDRAPQILLHAEGDIVIVGRLVVDVEALRVARRKSAGRLQERAHVTVVCDWREDSRHSFAEQHAGLQHRQ